MPTPAHVPVPRPTTPPRTARRHLGAPARTPSVEVVVIGAGSIGAATAWQLARRGHDVVLLEQFGPGHARAAAQGPARIYHQAFARPSAAALAVAALAQWRELEHQTGASLLHLTGGIDHGDPDRLTALAAALAAGRIRHVWLDPDEAAARWPGTAFAGPVLHQPDRAGRLDTGQAVSALTAAAVGLGATVRYSTPATRITVLGEDLVEVATPQDVVTARAVVVAAGTSAEPLAGGLLDLPELRERPEQVASFPVRGSTGCDPLDVDWPTVVHRGPGTGRVHGVPVRGHGAQVGFHEPVTGSSWLEQLQDHVAAFLPGLDHARPSPIGCTSTAAAGTGPLLARSGPVVVAAGWARRAAFAPAVARSVADLAADALQQAPAGAVTAG